MIMTYVLASSDVLQSTFVLPTAVEKASLILDRFVTNFCHDGLKNDSLCFDSVIRCDPPTAST